MEYYSSRIQTLMEELAKLPGIGTKTAGRLAFHLMNQPEEAVDALASALTQARKSVRFCRKCCTITDQELCPICSSRTRDHSQIMVVENPRDLGGYERTGRYNGVYHVLHGTIAKSLGIGPSDIRLKELMQRMQEEEIREVIIATGSTLEGETTAMYISQLIKPTGILTSRIASGVPVGGDLENIDEITLTRALDGRRAL